MSSVRDVKEKLRNSYTSGEPVHVTKRSQALFALRGSSVTSFEVADSEYPTVAPSTRCTPHGYLFVSPSVGVTGTTASAPPYLQCALEIGAVSLGDDTGDGMVGRSILYKKGSSISYDGGVLVPWDAVLMLL